MTHSKSPCNVLYFHGKITRDQAEDLLMSQGAIEGMFLLRESVNENFVISLCHNNKVNHYNIEKQADNSYQILTGRRFIGPVELVEHHMIHMDGFLALARIPLERYPSGASYYILQGLKSSLFDECLRKKAMEMGLRDKSSIEEALGGLMRKHLKHLVLKDLHIRQSWFHHFIRRLEADTRLEVAGFTEGQFLVRQRKEDNGFVLSLSCQGQSKHYRINNKLEKLYIDGGQYFDTLIELIDHYHFRQDGLLCKLRFAVECPGYFRSRIDNLQSSGDACFEGCHTSVCNLQGRYHMNHSISKATLSRLSMDKFSDTGTESDFTDPISELENSSPDLINFNEWSINLSKILTTEVSFSKSGFGHERSAPLPGEEKPQPGHVLSFIKNNIVSPQSILNNVKELFNLTKNGNQKDKCTDEPHILDQIWPDRETEFSSQVATPTSEQVQMSTRSKSLSMPIKLPTSDLCFLDPLLSERTKVIDDVFPTKKHSFDLSIDKLEIKQKLGGGNFGYVYGGFYNSRPGYSIPVAIKMLKKEIHSIAASQEIMAEATVMAGLVHRHIVRLIGICKCDQIFLILELAPLGPINKYLRRNINTPVSTLIELMNQVANAMSYLEAFKFVHRDLAARNVLLVNENYAKISDFGMSKALNYGHEYYRASAAGKWPLKWYAPECIYYFRFDSKSDVWSYGVTLWEVFSYGEKPYKDLKGTEILTMLDKGQRLRKPIKCPDCIYDIMLQCWTIESVGRPTFAELVVTTSRLSARYCTSLRDMLEQTNYQATSSGSSVAKTSYGSGDSSHCPVPPGYNTEVETWSKCSLSGNVSEIFNW